MSEGGTCGSQRGVEARQASARASATRPRATMRQPLAATSALTSTNCGAGPCRAANGATAISAQPSDAADDRRPELGAARLSSLAMLGTIENASHDDRGDEEAACRGRGRSAAPRRRSGSPLRSATRPPASMKIVARTSFNSGRRIGVPEARVREEQRERRPRAGRTAAPAPRGRPRSGRDASTASIGTISAERMTERILIVDDHPLTRDALAGLSGAERLRRRRPGARAATRRSPRSSELQPDLVLLDLSMPDMDGLTALPKLHDAAPKTEIVVLTASEDESNLLARDPRRRRRLPAEERAARADRRVPARRRPG